jgi:hypothetical protein
LPLVVIAMFRRRSLRGEHAVAISIDASNAISR